MAETLRSAFSTIRRQLPIFLIVVACTVTLGLFYVLTSPATYTATTLMVLDPHQVRLGQAQQPAQPTDASLDAGMVLTQIEILKSQNVSLSVIKTLHLTDDPEFVRPKAGLIGSLLGSLSGIFGGGGPPVFSETELEHRALGVFEAERGVARIGLTYVMGIGYQSRDPAKAARIANAIADAYIVDQLEAKYQATKRASVWLQERIKALRAQASAAQRAVVNYKQEHHIIDAGGQLMGEQELAEVNSQLLIAHAATAEAKARLDNIVGVMQKPIADGAVADALNNQVIVDLRQKYLQLSGKEALWAGKYGQNHLAVVNLRNQMLELRKNIEDEMRKIADSYKNNYEVALARETAIKSKLNSTITQSDVTNQARIQLTELESNAQTYQALYDNFLQNYMQAVQQESFPMTEARVISAALPPAAPSSPKTNIILPVTLLAGVALGFAAAFLREMSDRVFRTGAQIESRLQVNCLAMLPALRTSDVAPGARPTSAPSSKLAELFQPVNLTSAAPKLPKAMGLGASSANASASADRPPFASPPPNAANGADMTLPDFLSVAVNAPFSQFTEALRSIKVAIDLNGVVRSNRVIGLTSSIPNEGKSTVAVNLAQLIAHAGAKALLIDGDLRNPSLSNQLVGNMGNGLVDVLAGRCRLSDALRKDDASNLVFLPVGNAAKLMHTHDVLGSERMKQFMAELRDTYDYIIVDFAPLAPVVDTRVTSGFIDSYLYVVEWGRTKIDLVEHTLSAAPEIYDHLLGVVLNKADMNALKRYEHHRSNYYYDKYYSRYGYTA